LGSAGQLAALPLVGLAVVAATNPTPIVASSVLILGLCPGGGISNFYVYLARCNVFLSAILTGVATLLSLATIPGFLFILSYQNPDFAP
jgi:bile acid:Na+ symporter, BASS family